MFPENEAVPYPYQTILPQVDALVSALGDIAEHNLSTGRVGFGFAVIDNLEEVLSDLIEKEKIADKMFSVTEREIFVPQIVARFGRMLTVKPPYRTSSDPTLLHFKTRLATTAIWLLDNNSDLFHISERQKKVLGTMCQDGINSYLDSYGIDRSQGASNVHLVNQIGEKVRMGEINPDEIADMALLSAFVSFYTPSIDENLYPGIRRINLVNNRQTHNLISDQLNRSSLGVFFPAPSSFQSPMEFD